MWRNYRVRILLVPNITDPQNNSFVLDHLKWNWFLPDSRIKCKEHPYPTIRYPKMNEWSCDRIRKMEKIHQIYFLKRSKLFEFSRQNDLKNQILNLGDKIQFAKLWIKSRANWSFLARKFKSLKCEVQNNFWC